MFVIIDLSDVRKRRFEKYRKHIIETKRCDIFGSAPFFIARGHSEFYDYDELEGIIKRCGAALFKNKNIPDGLEKYEFSPSVLPLKMLIKTAAEFYRNLPAEKRNVKVSIYDRYARAVSETAELSRYVRFVSVMTLRPGAYRKAAQSVYEESGAVIKVRDFAEREKECTLTVALSDREIIPSVSELCIVYSKYSACDNVFAAQISTFMPEGYEKECDGIDRFRFFCALFETCGYRISEIPQFSDAKSILFKTFA